MEAPTSVVIAVVAFVVAEAAASPGFESFEVAKKRQLTFFLCPSGAKLKNRRFPHLGCELMEFPKSKHLEPPQWDRGPSFSSFESGYISGELSGFWGESNLKKKKGRGRRKQKLTKRGKFKLDGKKNVQPTAPAIPPPRTPTPPNASCSSRESRERPATRPGATTYWKCSCGTRPTGRGSTVREFF